MPDGPRQEFSIRQDTAMTYGGVLSFLRCRRTRDIEGADIVVSGVPFDCATTFRPGARFGPAAIRAASVQLAEITERAFPFGIDPFAAVGVADYGDCGKPVCCNTHLSHMPPVSMKMAKLQKASLDPTKISGRCGRLKCCLRYEYDTYEEIYKQLPPIGSDILTRDGQCRVLNQEILTEQLLVETEDHRRRLVHASEVLTVVRRGSNRSGGKGRKKGGDRRRSPDSTPSADSGSSSPPNSSRTRKKEPQNSPTPQRKERPTPPPESQGNAEGD